MRGAEFLVPIFLFLSVAAVFIVAITTKHRERMMMVEKGLSTEDIKALYAKSTRRDPLTSLKWGILAVFVGLGLLIGNVLDEYFGVNAGVIAGAITIFAGAGLLLYYRIASKRLEQAE